MLGPHVDKIKLFFMKLRVCAAKMLPPFLKCVMDIRTVDLSKCKNRPFFATGQKEGAPGLLD